MPKGKKYGGRKKGTPNKNTAPVREAFATFADETFSDFKAWVYRTAENDPKGAADMYLKACEYHVPKLGRVENTGEGGGPVQHVVEITREDKPA